MKSTPVHSLGKGEVDSSILSGSTSIPNTSSHTNSAQSGEHRRNTAPLPVDYPWTPYSTRSLSGGER